MTLAEQYRLSLYQDLGFLEGNNRLRLKRNRQDGTICVEKHVGYETGDIYEFLQTHPEPYRPVIYERIPSEGYILIIEEYIAGKTLEQEVHERDIPEREAASIIINLCEALLPLHRANPPIICRDIKAENIMRTNDGRIKLVDFNISRRFVSGREHDTVLLGTREYAAPEQFGYRQTDTRTDIYALGVLLNYLVIKKFPTQELLPGPLGQVVKKCTQVDPDQRYQDVGALCRALGGGRAAHGTLKRFFWERPPGFRTGNPLKMAVAILGYAYLAYICFTFKFTLSLTGAMAIFQLWLGRSLFFASQLVFIGIFFNYEGIRDRLPLVKSRRRFVRIIGYIIWELLLSLAFVLIWSFILSCVS